MGEAVRMVVRVKVVGFFGMGDGTLGMVGGFSGSRRVGWAAVGGGEGGGCMRVNPGHVAGVWA